MIKSVLKSKWLQYVVGYLVALVILKPMVGDTVSWWFLLLPVIVIVGGYLAFIVFAVMIYFAVMITTYIIKKYIK
jgi:cell division protein FtsW (lipid II flippase)